jgi:hypothetical protein
MEVHGIEIKVSRMDWLRELRKPNKSTAIQKYCDRWWVVVSDKEIVNVDGGELPPTWGLMVVKGGKLYNVVEAPKLKSEPLDRGFVAALLRRAHESMQDPDIEARVRGELKEEYEKRMENRGSHELTMLKRRNEELQATVDRYIEMGQISGVHINDWNYKDIAKAVGVVLGAGAPGLLRRLDQTWKSIDSLHGNLKEAMIELEEVAAIAEAENEPK